MDNYTVYTYADIDAMTWRSVIVESDSNEVMLDGWEDSSQDRLALTAVVKGLQYVQSKSDLARVTVYADSKYVKSGDADKETENIDLWRQLTRLEDSIGLVIQWVFKKPSKKIMNKEVVT